MFFHRFKDSGSERLVKLSLFVIDYRGLEITYTVYRNASGHLSITRKVLTLDEEKKSPFRKDDTTKVIGIGKLTNCTYGGIVDYILNGDFKELLDLYPQIYNS